MSARKTVRIADVVRTANVMLAAPGSTTDGRIAVAVLLERVLMDCNAYKGFRYLDSEYLPASDQTPSSVLRAGYDDTRRAYFGGVSGGVS